MAAKNNILLLGSIPLNAMIQKRMDSGVPPLLDDENPSINDAFLSIAEKVSIKIAQMKRQISTSWLLFWTNVWRQAVLLVLIIRPLLML